MKSIFIANRGFSVKDNNKIAALVFAVLIFVLSVPFISFAKDDPLLGNILEDRDSEWEITAGKMSYQREQGIYEAEGSVLITGKDQELFSDRAVYNEKTGIVEVQGNVRLVMNGDTLEGESGSFNLNNYTGQIQKGRIFLQKNHYYINGDTMERIGPNSYRVKNCRVTTCDGDKADWSITGSEVEVTLEGYGTVRNASFRIRDFPVFFLPYARFPAKTERQTGFLLPGVGYSSFNGADIEIPFFWAISDQVDATFYERYMTKRGFMQGAEMRYLSEDGSNGQFLFDILSDDKEKKDMNNPEESDISPFARTNETRYWLRARADQKLPHEFEVRLDADLVSDQDYLREFRGGLFGLESRPELADEYQRPFDETTSPVRRSALRFSRDKELYSFQAITSYYQIPEDPGIDQTPQPIYGLNFSMQPRSFQNIPFFFGLESNYDYIWRDVGQKGHSLSLTPEITMPLWLGPYFQLGTSFSYSLNNQWIDGQPATINSQSSNAYQGEVRLSTILERIYDYEWRDVKKLKHKVTPFLSYTYRNHNDPDRIRPWFEPMNADEDINRITLGFENLFDVRKEDKDGIRSYAQWGTFALSQGYDLDEATRIETPGNKRQPFEPLSGTLTLMPFDNIDFDAEARWDHYQDNISYTDVNFELEIDRSAGRKDFYRLGYYYEKDGSKGLNCSISLNLVPGVSAGSSLTRDIENDESSETNYWLQYQSQCWAIRLIAGKLDDVSTFMITFNLLGLGNLLN